MLEDGATAVPIGMRVNGAGDRLRVAVSAGSTGGALERKRALGGAPLLMHYNFVKIHSTLRTTPAQAAGVTDRLWEIEDLVALLEGP